MIFMSQSGLTDMAQIEQWNTWYLEHLRIMRTVTGITSAERFVTDTIGWPPSLAMYTIASAEVFKDPYYQKIRGMGSWLPLINKKYYHRNLFSGLDIAPSVAQDEVILVSDQATQPSGRIYQDTPFVWLQTVGLDRSTPFRGIAVIKAHLARDRVSLARTPNEIAIYKPVVISI